MKPSPSRITTATSCNHRLLKAVASVIFLTILFTGCRDKATVKDTKIRPRCIGTENFCIDSRVARDMITQFKTTFKRDGVQDSIWIDRCIIESLASYLQDNVRFDGIRIYSVASSLARGSGQIVDSTSIAIVLTKPRNGGHDNQWENKIPLPSCGDYAFRNVNLSQAAAEAMRILFRTRFRSTQPSYSTAVWLSACAIEKMANIVAAHPEVDGIRIHNAAYSQLDATTRPSQEYAIQSTFVIVPTKIENGVRIDDWDIFQKALQKDPDYISYKEKKDYRIFGAYNHGELCPRSCDTGGDGETKSKE